MVIRVIGFCLVTAAAAGAGFSMAAGVRSRVGLLQELETAMHLAKTEIEYLMTPLPELFLKLSESASGTARQFFRTVSFALKDGNSRSVLSAFQRSLDSVPLPKEEAQIMRDLGLSLGKYDLNGQSRALDLAIVRLHTLLSRLEEEKSGRCRSYGMLGVCAGLAAAILLV